MKESNEGKKNTPVENPIPLEPIDNYVQEDMFEIKRQIPTNLSNNKQQNQEYKQKIVKTKKRATLRDEKTARSTFFY